MQDEIFVPDERAARYGENCARAVAIAGFGGAHGIRSRLRKALRKIRQTARALLRYADSVGGNREGLPGEFVWFSDNAYAAEKECRLLMRELAGRLRLPVDGDGVPFVFHMAEALLKTGAETVTPERLRLFLEGVQRERVLTETECGLCLPMLRASAVGRIADVAGHIETVLAAYGNPQSDEPFGAEHLLREAHLRGSEAPELTVYAETAERLHQAAETSLRGALRVLRAVESAAYFRAVRAVSRTEQLLNADPAGIYPQMDERSQAYYRAELSRTARICRCPEHELAEEALKQSQTSCSHIGAAIVNSSTLRRRQRRWARLYLVLDFALPPLLAALLAWKTKCVWAALLALLPLWEVTRSLLLYLFGRHVPTVYLPALELKNGVPAEGKTLVAIALLAADEKQARDHAQKLEEYYLANRTAGDSVLYGLLADLPDAPNAVMPDDAAILQAAEEAIDALNARYGNRFVLLRRDRRKNERDGVYMAYERKRGAIGSLAAFVCGEPTADAPVPYGLLPSQLCDLRYLVALDADTEPEPDTVRKLVGAMLHPLNRAVVAPDGSRVTSGYGILQPRISTDLGAANATLFSRIFAGQGGTDPYASASGDVYQNLFSDSIFVGKGIIDLHAMHKVLKGKIADNRVLSHDLLEGSFLRTGYLPDAPLIDGFPSSVRSFYKRQARWTRGDVQLLPFLGRSVLGQSGERYQNPLPVLARLRICDNLRRALTAPAAFFCVAAYAVCQNAATAAAAIAALLSLSSPMLLNTVERCRNFTNKVSTRCHATIYAGFRGGLLQFFSRFLLLPFEAFVNLRAICQALWRMAVTKRKMLEWTTAAEAEKRSRRSGSVLGALAHEYRVFLPSMLAAAAVAVLGRNAVAFLGFGFWAAAPAYSWMLSQKQNRQPWLNAEDRAFLADHAARIWRYFDDRMTEADNFLPPDNYQAEPGGIVAHRTSPTNIGLALLAICGAEKLGLIAWDNARIRLVRVLSAVERMEKYRGHLYNWYDTRNLSLLPPGTVSSVDSGNLCAALIAVAEICREKGENALGKRCTALAEAADFRLFYDSDRRLMMIAVDGEGRRIGGYYDMLASEARLTSYFAIASGQIEKRHWHMLSRLLAEADGFSGLASWSGSLFEYLMPSLLMPDAENSLLYEAVRHAVFRQRRWGKRQNIPWGISESAFFAFDEAMNYQYKAHGVPDLGLQNGLRDELVVSPYSTYLAAMAEPKYALKNLRRLAALDGTQGVYGLYEAVDFAAERVGDDRGYRVCKCYMAHHMAMSLCAVCNLLTFAETGQPYLPTAFFQNTAMRSCKAMLAERMPINAVNVRRIRETPTLRQHPTVSYNYRLTTQTGSAAQPQVNLLANRSTTLLTASSGQTCLFRGAVSAYRRAEWLQAGAPGCAVAFVDETHVLSATAYPQGDDAVHTTVFDARRSCYSTVTDGLHLTMEISLAESDACEQRTVTVHNVGAVPLAGDLIVFLEPLCGNEADDRAHPAFFQLFLTTEAVKNGASASRRNRRGETVGALALVTDCDDAVFMTDGDSVCGGDDPRFVQSWVKPAAEAVFGAVRFPVIRMRVPVQLAAGETRTVRFVIALGETIPLAAAVGERILARPFSAAAHVGQTARRLALSGEELPAALALLPRLWFGGERSQLPPETDKDALWQLGISGDLPVVLADALADGGERAGTLFRAVRMHALLSACGVRYDLCLLIDDGKAYERAGFRLCHSAIRLASAGASVGIAGGIHLVDLSAISPRSVAALQLAACSVLPLRSEWAEAVPAGTAPTTLPRKRIWSQPLCNPTFGCLSTDYGLSHLWYKNARMVKLTAWDTAETGEMLCAVIGGRRVSLTAGAECSFAAGYTVWRKKIGDLHFETKVCVLPTDALRVAEVACDGGKAEIEWYIAPLLAESETDRKGVVTHAPDRDCIVAENPFLRRFGSVAAAFAVWPPACAQTCGQTDWLCGVASPQAVGSIAAFRLWLSPQNPRAVLAAAAADCAAAAVALAKHGADPTRGFFAEARDTRLAQTQLITVSTPSAPLDRYLNDWNVWQIKGARLFARSSLYQNGGAIGFRDQLQDALALLPDEPQILRALLCLCAAHQYVEGDVQHWFHIGFADQTVASGVRTRCSDDLLWLPLAVGEYVARTGDLTVLAEQIPFLESPPLRADEHERYEDARVGGEIRTLSVHCLRALEQFFTRGTGEHGLPLMLGGDWNDGMNAVGLAGRGESVWLAWFAALAARRFADVCERLDDPDTAQMLRARAAEMFSAADVSFAADRYARAYTDDGRVLGTAESQACRIDSIAQSFAWLAAEGTESEETRTRMRVALQSALAHLVDPKRKIVRLFDPPFAPEDGVGYIGTYPAGVRENGGQYTHAAVWLAMACFAADRPDDGWEILEMLLPETHDPSVYGGEDFVLAADVGGEGNFAGVCGWSWYTGSAAWYRRAVLESMLGIRFLPDGLCVMPCLPSKLPHCRCRLQLGKNTVGLAINRSANGKRHVLKFTEGKTVYEMEVR
ncbi:MAG: hypothetical protein IJC93_02435 [Clostridia bacterium]|nr:hypothetical protein [Clostridia bacterium]